MGIGILLAYIFGAFLSYYTVPWASLPFSIIFLVGMYRVPETPLYLLKTRRFDVSSGGLPGVLNSLSSLSYLLGFRTRRTR
jgi:Sugar (and other) transporter